MKGKGPVTSVKSIYCNISISPISDFSPPLSVPMVACLSFPPSRRFPGRLRVRPISRRTALWCTQERGLCDRVSAHLTEDTSHKQHFGKQAPLFTTFVLLEMMGLIRKHKNRHAVSMFTKRGEEGEWDSVHGCKQKPETLHLAQNNFLFQRRLHLSV